MSLISNQISSDADLIKGSVRGERRMQHELYHRFAPKMFGVCLRYTASPDEAQDVLQEGFIKVFGKMGSYRGTGTLEGWMRRIFVNTAIEQFRKKNRLQPITEQEEETIENDDLSVIESLAQKDIVNLVQRLAPGYRTVFNLYVIEGYSHKEIGRMLGISEGTSKSQLSRAKTQLKTMLTPDIEQHKTLP